MFVQVPASISGLFLVSSPRSKMLGRLVILRTITNLLKLEVLSQMSWFRPVSDLQIQTKCCSGEETFENQVWQRLRFSWKSMCASLTFDLTEGDL